MILIETARLTLRRLTTADASFICALLHEDSFLRFLGDREVRNMEDAAPLIETRNRQSARDHGYGLYLQQVRGVTEPVGICGFM